MDLPAPLLEQVRSGRVVLFLGAGASVDAKRTDGTAPPLAVGLSKAISKHFLGGSYPNEQLAWVSELAISASNLSEVQDFIAEKFNALAPADYHLLLPTFRWRGIVTTNYDRLIEEIYSKSSKAVQTAVPFISNQDRVDEKLRSADHVGLLKIHGCVTRTHDSDLPLILTTDQYVTHRKNRDRLFKTFQEWAVENPIVFIGHAVQDFDIRAILLELSKELDTRPRYYIVKPRASDFERNFWAEKRVTLLSGTFEEFLREIDRAIPPHARVLARILDTDHPICRHFAVHESLNSNLKNILEQDLEYVHQGMKYDRGSPEQFYKGFDLGWYPIVENLDVRRKLTDTLLFDVIIRSEEDRPTRSELYVIRAEAGAGKSIFLKRLAWEASIDADAICLVLRPSASLYADSIQEIYRYTKKRVFLFVDDAADNVPLLLSILQEARRDNLPVTVIAAERLNEWNIACENLDGYVSEYYPLRYLNHEEVKGLVNLLRKHNSLGPNLQGKPVEDQVKEFEERAGRQLLVALHEATLGVPFEETLVDEYYNIVPERARRLYLTVCILNRLEVPVRAGLVARLEGIPFDQFRQEFLGPLEHVVLAKKPTEAKDYSYSARHPEIAQIIFERILTDPIERFNEYVRILKQLNVSFSSDFRSFRKLVRAKSLHDLFPDDDSVKEIFSVAGMTVGEDAFLYHQLANYERVRTNGNFETARKMLRRAMELDPRNSTFSHTLGELLREQAGSTEKPLKRKELRLEAKAVLTQIKDDPVSGRYAKVSLVRLGTAELKDFLNDESSTDRDIDEAIRSVERMLLTFKQELPRESYLLNAEADFRGMLKDYERSFIALRSAFQANPRDPYTASRLANMYEERGDLEAAQECIYEALQKDRSNLQLNYRFAQLVKISDPENIGRITYHFRRSFLKWDDNYEAQFWYARYTFESLDRESQRESKEIFRRLREVRMRYNDRVKVREVIQSENQNRVFTGMMERVELHYGFLRVDGTGDSLFVHSDNLEESTWEGLREGDRVAFTIGFTFSGSRALNLNCL